VAIEVYCSTCGRHLYVEEEEAVDKGCPVCSSSLRKLEPSVGGSAQEFDLSGA
jgi:predicted RNA-binding Zn-ribbon protein involved in translation (DUF1610 family)